MQLNTKNILKLAVPILLILLPFFITLILSSLPFIHTEEYKGYQNTQKACNWCTNGSGCSCSAYAGQCVEKYRVANNLTYEEFPTYVLANNEFPPLW